MNRELENRQTRELQAWREDVARAARRRARRAWDTDPKTDWRGNLLEIAGLVALLALAALFVWLCCAASDYHFA